MCSSRTLLLVLGLLGTLCNVTWAQPDNLDRHQTAIHLVGHEDDELLRRIKDLIDDWDPRRLVNPYVETISVELPNGEKAEQKRLRRKDLNQFIADVDAAEMLGKALFWDMQAGSDFQRVGKQHVGMACATCHYRSGADARDRFTTRIPYVVWDRYWDPKGAPPAPESTDQYKAHPFAFGEKPLPFDVVAQATQPYQPQLDSPLSLIVGSQGVEARVFHRVKPANEPPFPDGTWEESEIRKVDDFKNFLPDWSMFIAGQTDQGQRFRQITTRNSPSVINSGFSDRLFHDGRAESTFNGFSIFGDYDGREILYRVDSKGEPKPAHVAIPDAALASQAVGPIVNDVEMSYVGRTFHHVACKLLPAHVLAHQKIDPHDSVLGELASQDCEKRMTYEQLIRRAFRREWWDSCTKVPLNLSETCETSPEVPEGTLMEANFSLYWGLSIMLYEASLVSNDAPFDQMMLGNGKPVNDLWERFQNQLAPIQLDRTVTSAPQPELKFGTEVFQRGFRVFMNRGCVECHSGPLFSEVYERDRFDDNTLPIAHTVNHVLLPNAQGDSLAIKLQEEHNRVLMAVESIIPPENAQHARRMTLEMDDLRQYASGSPEILQSLIVNQFKDSMLPVPVDSATADSIARLLMTYEKNLASHIGNRTFFTEAERVAAANLMAEPVLVETMRIPPNQQENRRGLPITSILDRSYAFYDLGYYNLGVSPPRYDRGVGHSSTVVQPFQTSVAVAAQDTTESVVPDEADDNVRKAVQAANLKGLYLELLSPKGKEKEKVDNQPNLQEIRQAIDGVPGKAYEFPSRYRQMFRGKGDGLEAVPNAAPPNVNPCQSAGCNPDEALYDAKITDRSWDRDDLIGSRRGDRHFLSRARRLVLDEHSWGFRKPLIHDNELAFWGAFKTPTLRNVALTAPYMHNGRLSNLFEVVDFYERAGDVPRELTHNPDKHPEIVPLDMTDDDQRALVFFLYCLTDPRVEYERAPFDHPSLCIVNGYREEAGVLKEQLEEVRESGASQASVVSH
ncbi:MAG: cytochrome c peroxidase [Planctomycetaceae bacterium]